MAQEIEHKFLVTSDCFKTLGQGTLYRQGYIPTRNGMTVRVRIAGAQGFVTFKDHAVNLTRHEFEYPIPEADARQMLELLCEKPQVEKTRYIIPNVKAQLPDGSPIEGLLGS
jgi:adenylate cyclase